MGWIETVIPGITGQSPPGNSDYSNQFDELAPLDITGPFALISFYPDIKNLDSELSENANAANAANAQANIEDEGSDAPAHDTSDMFGIKDETPAETFSILTVIIIIGIVLLVVLTCAIYQYGKKRKYLKELNAIADVQNNEQNNESDPKQSVIDITHTQTKD